MLSCSTCPYHSVYLCLSLLLVSFALSLYVREYLSARVSQSVSRQGAEMVDYFSIGHVPHLLLGSVSEGDDVP